MHHKPIEDYSSLYRIVSRSGMGGAATTSHIFVVRFSKGNFYFPNIFYLYFKEH